MKTPVTIFSLQENVFRKASLPLAIACASLLLAGCGGSQMSESQNSNPDNNMTSAKEHAEKAASEMKAAAQDAWKAFADYTVEKRDQAASFLEKQASQLDGQIEDLRDDLDNLSGEAKERYNESVDELAAARRDLQLQATKLRNATEENWQEVRNETKKQWDEFNDAVAKLRKDMSE